MKVIKDGVKPSPAVCTCPHCKAFLEYDDSDIRRSWNNRLMISHEYYINCGFCHKEIPVRKVLSYAELPREFYSLSSNA